MPAASYIQSSFIGGLVSKWTQGRYHDQKYRTWMADSLNGFPTETESWTRRPGTLLGFGGKSRQGHAARLIKFDFNAGTPYTIELTDLYARFWQSTTLLSDSNVILLSISSATPAVLELAQPVTWATGDEVYLTGLGVSCPTLQNRRFTITKIDTTHFSISSFGDPDIVGADLGAPAAGAIVSHVFELTPFFSQADMTSVNVVQTQNTAFFLISHLAPTQITMNSVVPSTPAFFGNTYFIDGPYLDEIPGSTVTASAVTGSVTLTLGFQAYIATQAYKKGDFVTSSSIGYQSLVDFNVGNTPASSPSDWQVVGFGAPINGGAGFVQTDVGRLVRLFSEPALWASGTTYGSGTLVSYNPSNLPGEATYWSSFATGNVGNVPGTDATHWQLLDIGSTANPALWTWGKISGFSSSGSAAAISGATGTNIGNMTDFGGLAAAFDGTTSKTGANCAADNHTADGNGFVGKNYGGSPTAISQVVIYPSSDDGFAFGLSGPGSITLNLWGSNSAPTGPRNGTLLGTGTVMNNVLPATLQSNSGATTWQYVWVEIITPLLDHFAYAVPIAAQVIFFNNSATPSTGVTVSIFGPPLLYAATTIQRWRLGLYSDTTGWPNVGTYAEGRLWLASAGFPNRIDACVADGISGVNNGELPGYVNFAPTDQFGNVTDANAIDYVFNAPDATPILWMIPDLQGVLAGTAAGEWIVQAPGTGGISPSNIVARRATTIGSANIEPRRTEHTIVYVQRYLRKIVEYFADVFSGKFTAPNLIKDAKELTIGNLQEIAYQQELAPILWARVNDGLIGCVYKRDTLMTSAGPTISAWHRHQLGSGRPITSIVVGSAVNGTLDALMMVTQSPTAAYIEVLQPIPDEGTSLANAPYLDSAIVPTSTALIAVSGPDFPYGGLQLNGLWPLNGSIVTAWLGGLDCGDYTVSSGSISVPFGDGVPNGQGTFPASSGANRGDQGLFTQDFVNTGVTANGNTMFTGTMPALVGFTYTSQGQVVRPNAPAESGARSGPAFGKKRRSQWIMAQFEGSQGVSWGVQFDSTLLPVNFAQPNGTSYTVDLQFSGIVRDNLQADYDFDNLLCWQVTRPYICNVQTIGAAIETQDL